MPGEGDTQPCAGSAIPANGTTSSATFRRNAFTRARAASPEVNPYTSGPGKQPTKLSKRGSSTGPSTTPASGFGRSHTTTRFPCAAAASSTYRRVDT